MSGTARRRRRATTLTTPVGPVGKRCGGSETMLARSLTALQLVALLLMLAPVSAATARTISWSGHEWDVRPEGVGGPGPNRWSDSSENVRIEGSDLVLSIVRDSSGTWTSAEVDNRRHLGYGTYRWVVASDLSALDANEVLGMFTYGGGDPSNNELDIEASHWGNRSWPSGSATVWQNAATGRRQSAGFAYSDKPPYVNQFTWLPGGIRYLVTDATGATLLDWTTTGGVPAPSSEVPVINYWRSENVPPEGPRSMRISSFAWAPPDDEDELPSLVAPGGSSTAGDAEAPWRCAIAKAPSGPRGAAVTWTASGRATLQLAVRRRVARDRFVTVRTLNRSLRNGTGRIRFARAAGGGHLRPGSYRLAVTVARGASRVRCGPRTLRLVVPGREQFEQRRYRDGGARPGT